MKSLCVIVLLTSFQSAAVGGLPARTSDVIALVDVRRADSYWATDGRPLHIHTVALLTAERFFKGSFHENPLWIDFIGGIVGGIGEAVNDVPTLRLGERAYCFFRQRGGSLDLIAKFPVSGSLVRVGSQLVRREQFEDSLSHFGDDALPDQINRMVFPSLPLANPPVLDSISPAIGAGGMQVPVTLTGLNFGPQQGSGFVSFGAGGVHARVVSWSDMRIDVTVPPDPVPQFIDAGSGPVFVVRTDSVASDGLVFTMMYNYSGIRWARHNPTVVPYFITENYDSLANPGDGVQAAFARWNGVGANSRFVYAGPSANSGARFDGLNTISWDSLPPGIVATHYGWYSVLADTLLESDIVFNRSLGFSMSDSIAPGHFDICSVALHELGHALGLNHTIGDIGDGQNDIGKIMFPQQVPGRLYRFIHPYEMLAARTIYGCRDTVDRVRAVVAASGGSGSVGVIAGGECVWTAHPNNSWIHLTSDSSGTGPGTVSFATDLIDPDSLRSGTMTVAGNLVTVIQSSRTWRVGEGWSMVSLPVLAEDSAAAQLFPVGLVNAYGYERDYQPASFLHRGEGYWLKFDATQSVSVPGLPFATDTIDLRSGWNMVGGVSRSAAAAAIVSLTPGLVISPFFGYDSGGYRAADTLLTGSAYWVRASMAGRIIVSSQPVNSTARVRIEAGNFSPPPPPESGKNIAVLASFGLGQNYPNPFNPTTQIDLSIPSRTRVSVAIYSIAGQKVADVLDQEKDPGRYTLTFDARALSSGVYYYRMIAGAFSETRKLIVLK